MLEAWTAPQHVSSGHGTTAWPLDGHNLPIEVAADVDVEGKGIVARASYASAALAALKAFIGILERLADRLGKAGGGSPATARRARGG